MGLPIFCGVLPWHSLTGLQVYYHSRIAHPSFAYLMRMNFGLFPWSLLSVLVYYDHAVTAGQHAHR